MQLIVLGMHRSGTSVVTRLLNMMGAYFASEGMHMPADEGNRKGYWERNDVYQLNKTLLSSMSFSWDKIVNFDKHSIERIDKNTFLPEATKIILDLDAHRPWVLKDPRMCFLFPVWRELLEVPVCVHVYRNPVEVARSLEKRNGIPLSAGLGLWEKYNVHALAASAELPRLLISYTDIMADPRSVVYGLYKELEDQSVTGLRLPSEREITAFVSTELRHHHLGDRALRGFVNDTQRSLYRAFETRKVFNRKSPYKLSPGGKNSIEYYEKSQLTFLDKDRITVGIQEQLSAREEELISSIEILEKLKGQHAQLKGQHEQLKGQHEQLKGQHEQLKGQHEQLKGQQEQLKGQQEQLKVKLERIKSKFEKAQKTLLERTEHLSKLSNWLDQLKIQLSGIFSSHTWRAGRMIVSVPRRLIGSTTSHTAQECTVRILREYAKWCDSSYKETKIFPAIKKTGIAKGQGTIRRLFKEFDQTLDQRTRRGLRNHINNRPDLSERLVSVVMPTYNRASHLSRSVGSLLAQNHVRWELLLIDDGSEDDTEHFIRTFTKDSRIRYVRVDRGGVGAARNKALNLASGEIIAFLDSDNEWDPEFLSLMVAGMDLYDIPITYSGVELICKDETVGYRGDLFDYKSCYAANYVDINALCHRREFLEDGIRFDENIRRFNDWDYILSLTYKKEVRYLPFVGVKYTLHTLDDQITLREPYIYRRIVKARHRRRLEESKSKLESVKTIVRELTLSFAIRIAAPRENKESWGDHHYALGVGQAIERSGHIYKVFYLGEEVKGEFDVVIVLRGLTNYQPVPGLINVLWNISHPDLVEYQEFESFDLVFVASKTSERMLRHILPVAPYCLLQATDRGRFFPNHGTPSESDELLFVGNSRNIYRNSVKYAVEADLPIAVYGNGWVGLAPERVVRGEYIPNEVVRKSYASTRAVLNDHWQSMKDFGYISNRIYDVLASGSLVISDWFPELEHNFGNMVLTYRNPAEFTKVALKALGGDVTKPEIRKEQALMILEDHSFDNRVEDIVRSIHAFLGSKEDTSSVMKSANGQIEPLRTRARVHSLKRSRNEVRFGFMPQVTKTGRWSSSAYIRLILPLTADVPGQNISLKFLDPRKEIDTIDFEDLDVLVVSRTALASKEAVNELQNRLKFTGTVLVVDIDDGFHKLDNRHPDFEIYRERIGVLNSLLEVCAEIWCSTEMLRLSLNRTLRQKACVIENTVDPRIWRRYRNREKNARPHGRVEILYMGTTTHANDLDLVLPALDELADDYPDRFRLSIIGVSPSIPERNWLNRVPVRVDPSYPRFARWLRKQAGDFDIGIAPLVDSQFNVLKSDIKVLEYTTMGLRTVASGVGPYESVIQIDRCHSKSEWVDVLGRIIGNPNELVSYAESIEEQEKSVWNERTSAVAGRHMLTRAEKLLS